MTREGQIVLFRFPTTDHAEAKLRPALVVRKLPGSYDDWLVCMITSQIGQAIDGFDEVIRTEDPDFASSGLKAPSVFRISRLAVVHKQLLVGAIGNIDSARLRRIKENLGAWLAG